MLPGRGTAAELAFYKKFLQRRRNVFDLQPHSARALQLEGLSLGYASAVIAARLLVNCVSHVPGGLKTQKALELLLHEFVIRVINSMQ